MKKMMVVASLFLGVAGFTVPIRAAQQSAGPEIKQSVTKKSKAVATHAGVSYKGQPRFVSIQETSISYATNTPEEVINIGSNFYLVMQDVWFVAAGAQGPWRLAPFVPEVVAAVVCSNLHSYPYDPYQFCALPWSSGLSYIVWKPS